MVLESNSPQSTIETTKLIRDVISAIRFIFDAEYTEVFPKGARDSAPTIGITISRPSTIYTYIQARIVYIQLVKWGGSNCKSYKIYILIFLIF